MAKESPQDRSSTDDRDDDAVRCAACDYPITHVRDRIEQGGAHEHTFVNPGGIVHHIGCYHGAPGCMYVGATEEAFSWFPGWSWQIALCGACHAHLGWIFRCGPDSFHGLITAALRQ